ncbi:MAG: VTT domain-containing protein [Pygmaiobacter sp.]
MTVFVLFHWRNELVALITTQSARDEFIAYVRATGWGGLAAFLGLQVLQVLVAVIPGEPVEIMAGVLYGTLGGLLLCLGGVLIGSVLIYYFVKLLGANPLEGEKYKKYHFLQEPRRVELLIFLLFLIPGTPKDILLYFAPFLPLRPEQFFLFSILARIPSIISSTFAGANLARGEFGMMAMVFLVTSLAGLLGLLYNEKLLAFCSARNRARRARRAHRHEQKH